VPIAYNSSGYDEPRSLALLDGVLDVYLPDLKVWPAGQPGVPLSATCGPSPIGAATLSSAGREHARCQPLFVVRSGPAALPQRAPPCCRHRTVQI